MVTAHGSTTTPTTLLRGATLITMDPALGEITGDLLISGSRIEAVGPRLDTPADEVIDVSGSIIIPGLIDTHVHLWHAPLRGLAAGCWGREYFGLVHPLAGRYRPSDIGSATYAGAVELLRHGVTTALDFCHATLSREHTDASLDALDRSGIRGLFGFCFRHRPEAGDGGYGSFDDRVEHLRELTKAWAGHERVGLAVALNNIDHVTPDVHAEEVRAARALGLRSTVHSNLQEQVWTTHNEGLLGDDILWVHAGAISDPELDLLAQHGGAVVCTPEAEAAFMGVTPVVARARQRGVPTVFGTDVPAAVNGDMFVQLRVAHLLSRLVDAQGERRSGRTGARTPWIPSFDAPELLRLATMGSAEVLGIDDRVGSLTPGKEADLIVVSPGPFGTGAATPSDHVVLQASGRDIESVYVGGRRRVHHGELVGVDTAAVRAELDEARGWVLGTAADAEWPAIDAAMRARYEAGQGSAT